MDAPRADGSHSLRTRRRSCCTRDQRQRLVRSRNRLGFSSQHGARDRARREVRRATRMVSPTAYEAGEIAGASLAINPGIRGT